MFLVEINIQAVCMQAKKARTNKERSEATREALLAAARKLFVAKGYAETSTPEIVAEAGITRGALYHHFEDKRALFRAVVEEEARSVVEEIERSARQSRKPIEALLAGSDAYLKAMAVKGRTRLLLIDGPAVLGAAAMRTIDEETSEQSLRAGLEAAMADQGGAALTLVAGLLSAAFDRAALLIEGGESPREVGAAMKLVVERTVGSRQRAAKG
jgi:AcrR family transcriptional regulator